MKWQAGLAGALASVRMTTGCGRSSPCCAGVKNSDFKTATYVGLGRIAPADYYDGEDD